MILPGCREDTIFNISRCWNAVFCYQIINCYLYLAKPTTVQSGAEAANQSGWRQTGGPLAPAPVSAEEEEGAQSVMTSL